MQHNINNARYATKKGRVEGKPLDFSRIKLGRRGRAATMSGIGDASSSTHAPGSGLR
jgi:hypothetical protein